MKNSTLRCSNRMLLIFGISSISVLSHFNSYSQSSSVTSKSQDLKNIQVPQFANETERQEWILSHPEEYKFLTGQYKEEKIEAIYSNGFPQFVNTGDPEKDGKIYQERKQAWIIAHPEEYKLMIENQININK